MDERAANELKRMQFKQAWEIVSKKLEGIDNETFLLVKEAMEKATPTITEPERGPERRISTRRGLKAIKCTGSGQGSCKRCDDKGKWNRTWMCFLYKIEGLEGVYCSDCVTEILMS